MPKKNALKKKTRKNAFPHSKKRRGGILKEKDESMPRVALKGRTSHGIKGVARHDHFIGHLGVPHGFALFCFHFFSLLMSYGI